MKGKSMLCALLAACLLAGCAPPSRDSGAAELPAFAPAATRAPESPPPASDAARAVLESMSLRDKVGQLFFIRPDALDPGILQADIDNSAGPGVTALSPEMRGVLTNYPVGGMVLFQKNILSPEQVGGFLNALQAAAPTPLLFCVDEEGGAVTRLASAPGFDLPRYESAAAVGCGGIRAAEDMGRSIGTYLRQYGFHLDFAPVADVNTNPRSPVIGSRAFSSRPEAAAALTGAMARGLQSQGVIPTFKHFPGHGDTAEDSHLTLAVTDKTPEELMACEWLPYLKNDLTNCAVMVGHIAAPGLTGDMAPASLSRAAVTDALRGRLGFQGLVITDSMSMEAVTRRCGPGEAAVLALQAGCDVILMPHGLGAAFEGVLDALERGELTESRLDESVYRVLRYKDAAGLL